MSSQEQPEKRIKTSTELERVPLSDEVRAILGVPDYYDGRVNASSMLGMWCVIEAMLEAFQPETIVEIGVEFGNVTRLLAEYCQKRGKGVIHCVDPALPDMPAWPNVLGHKQTSADYFRSGVAADCYLIDGDHNYETVLMELQNAARLAPADRPLLILLNDVSWPCARHDSSYAPSRLHNPDGVEFVAEGCVSLGQPGLTNTGFPSFGEFFYRADYGGPRNGVLTAVEDFITANPEGGWHFSHYPILYGLGILWREGRGTRRPTAIMDETLAALERLRPLLAVYEANRLVLLEQYFRQGLQMQHQGEIWQKQQDWIGYLEGLVERQKARILALEQGRDG